ncbi:hypothetical protein [Frigidibacter sp. MR17.24]|uniref:hypothetical protein n=1 Tax=Frigidibacter sp. MR17.24 TaxID=3127345 RepID=UPI0030131541
MQRLLLLVALGALVVLGLRWVAARVGGDTPATLPARPAHDGPVAKLAFAALFLVIAATSAGWLEGL